MLSVNMKNNEASIFTGKLTVDVRDDHTVSINGELNVEAAPDGNGYTLSYPDAFGSFALRNKNTPGNIGSTFKSVVGTEYDPYFYKSSDNGLSVDQSTDRAYRRVMSMLPSAWTDPDDNNDIWEAIKKKIRNGDGRQSVYVLVGGIVKGWNNGMYKGVPFGYILRGFVDGKIEAPEPPRPKLATLNRPWWDR